VRHKNRPKVQSKKLKAVSKNKVSIENFSADVKKRVGG
jgi:hypothetical protein